MPCVDSHTVLDRTPRSGRALSLQRHGTCEVGLCRLSRADFNSGSYLPGTSRIHDDTVVAMKGPNRRHSRPLCCNIFIRTRFQRRKDPNHHHFKWNVWKKGGNGQSLCCDDVLELRSDVISGSPDPHHVQLCCVGRESLPLASCAAISHDACASLLDLFVALLEALEQASVTSVLTRCCFNVVGSGTRVHIHACMKDVMDRNTVDEVIGHVHLLHNH